MYNVIHVHIACGDYMDKKLIKTIRLNDNEALILKEAAFNFSKENILNDVHIIYKESDLIHFMIEHLTCRLDINKKGELIFIEDQLDKTEV